MYDEALYECNKVLEIDECNVKGHFRRGQAYLGKQDFDLALKDFAKVQQLEPDDKGVVKEIAKVKLALRIQNKKDKEMFAKMFN